MGSAVEREEVMDILFVGVGEVDGGRGKDRQTSTCLLVA